VARTVPDAHEDGLSMKEKKTTEKGPVTKSRVPDQVGEDNEAKCLRKPSGTKLKVVRGADDPKSTADLRVPRTNPSGMGTDGGLLAHGFASHESVAGPFVSVPKMTHHDVPKGLRIRVKDGD
jgi:hypothetical protein